ncbi:MAG: aa3-type cytochrome c oxidase subunit IV [Pseudomonadota bacterium]
MAEGEDHTPGEQDLKERANKMSEHEHGKMDITEQERTFETFIKGWIYLFGASAAILILLALFNS